MTAIYTYLSGDHKNCDEFFIQAEEIISKGDWNAAEKSVGTFLNAMEEHFLREETILFPAFEEKTGMTAGPTVVMRLEHDQMRELFKDLRKALDNNDGSEYLGVAETLLMMMQQHNMKEEQILYQMSDRVLAMESAGLVTKMKAFTKGS